MNYPIWFVILVSLFFPPICSTAFYLIATVFIKSLYAVPDRGETPQWMINLTKLAFWFLLILGYLFFAVAISKIVLKRFSVH